jgi:cobyrinic acid a,c-diamide synthase
MLKVMITAAASNSGKTAVTCGLLSLLKRKEYDPCAFKCGPDYIDPMFHRSVLGISSNNLDVFLAGEDGVKDVFARNSKGHGAAVCEGVMGYYDGVRCGAGAAKLPAGAAGDYASAYHVASLLDIPAILVVRPKGAALTLAAVIKGVAEFRDDSRICGVIFNDCSEMYYKMYGSAIEEASGVPVLGYVPHMEEANFESRHLGLMTAEEITDLAERIDRIGQKMEETIDLERLLALAGTEPDAQAAAGAGTSKDLQVAAAADVRIAVARDEAFNFIYAETLTALEDAGAEIVFFSPVHDAGLPENIDGLYLPGGYPELYGRQLAENASMREQIREAVTAGLPTIAECGGFLYLSAQLEDTNGVSWPMVGVLPGSGSNAGKLVRFGYGTISAEKDTMLLRAGEKAPVHEFHYWDTTAGGSDMTLTKLSTGAKWNFGYASETLYAGFPHLYLGGGQLAERFIEACRRCRR